MFTNVWKLRRIPEPEAMDDAEEVASYNSAAAGQHLEAIDNTFIEHLLRLLPSAHPGAERAILGLDVGAGPAQIPVKILSRFPGMKMIAVDRSERMLAYARQNAWRADVSARLLLARADAHQLPFADGSFSVVISNSMLHHARDPVRFLGELFRVAAPRGAVLIRDLRRPWRPLLRWHLWRHGRAYSGRMRQLFDSSVGAAYTEEDLRQLLRQAGISTASVYRFGSAHIGVQRAATQAAAKTSTRRGAG